MSTATAFFSKAPVIEPPRQIDRMDFEPLTGRSDIGMDFLGGFGSFIENRADVTKEKVHRNPSRLHCVHRLHDRLPHTDVGVGPYRIMKAPFEGFSKCFNLFFETLIPRLTNLLQVHSAGRTINLAVIRPWNMMEEWARPGRTEAMMSESALDETAAVPGDCHATHIFDLSFHKASYVAGDREAVLPDCLCENQDAHVGEDLSN